MRIYYNHRCISSLPAGKTHISLCPDYTPGMIALMRAGQARARGDMPETVKKARKVLDLTPENDYLMLGGAASQLGLAAWTSGDLDAARQMTAEGMENVRLAGYITPAIGGAIVLKETSLLLFYLYSMPLSWQSWRATSASSLMPHRSHRSRPRTGFVISMGFSQYFPSVTKNNTYKNTKVSIR
ncbi:MAG TPA: hypothetical protein VK206_20010 [Anaerolineales bacterium]|nr:hypothetical protein [Anaerolineales bacterium]HLO31167.1 hypothetical protein [Anaerolineales bacterium]